MHKHYLSLIKPYLIILIIVMGLMGCEDEATKQPKQQVTKKEKTTPPKKQPVPVPKKEKPKPFLSSENVVEFLTQYGKKNPETILDIYTSFGKVRVRLYKDTPLHRASFVLLSKSGYFDRSTFTRVAPFFIAQGGGVSTDKQDSIVHSIGLYSIPKEFKRHHFHKRGALAAARRYKKNPEKRSNPYAFYFVEGTMYNTPTLDRYEKENNYKFSEKQRAYYLKHPSAAHLDGQHTVFGEIISGYDVVPQLTQVETDSRDWPKQDLFVDSIKVIR